MTYAQETIILTDECSADSSINLKATYGIRLKWRQLQKRIFIQTTMLIQFSYLKTWNTFSYMPGSQTVMRAKNALLLT